MVIKCPVCSTIYEKEINVCTTCRFTELNRVFLSEGDYQKWLKDIVRSFQGMYLKECVDREELKRLCEEQQREKQKQQQEIFQEMQTKFFDELRLQLKKNLEETQLLLKKALQRETDSYSKTPSKFWMK